MCYFGLPNANDDEALSIPTGLTYLTEAVRRMDCGTVVSPSRCHVTISPAIIKLLPCREAWSHVSDFTVCQIGHRAVTLWNQSYDKLAFIDGKQQQLLLLLLLLLNNNKNNNILCSSSSSSCYRCYCYDNVLLVVEAAAVTIAIQLLLLLVAIVIVVVVVNIINQDL